MDRQKMLPAVEKFVGDMRAICAETEGEDRWTRCRDLLTGLLADPEVQAHAKDWPAGPCDGGRPENLLFYEDPDYGFVINGLIKDPGGFAVPHDHGPSWTVYGVLAGNERIVRFRQRDDGLEETRVEQCGPGTVDVVPPDEIHAEVAGDERTVAVIVRSQRSGTFRQFRYEDDGTPIAFGGPMQVPYRLG